MKANKAFMEKNKLVVRRGKAMLWLQLNRPEALNSLEAELVLHLESILREAAEDDGCRFLLLSGAGKRGFCAGGDIKSMARALRKGRKTEVLEFLAAEYDVDLLLHRFPKMVVVLAHGVCMGGGLGLSAGADLIVVEEGTVMAMPESRIGFFPDVGATGWLFGKCPPGYPEFLGLSGYHLRGGECVRLGLATHLLPAEKLPGLASRFYEMQPAELPDDPLQLREILKREIEVEAIREIPGDDSMDSWVREIFSSRTSMLELRDSLSSCSLRQDLCRYVFSEFSERSPTAMALTLKLLRANQHLDMAEVFASDLRAASFMLDHNDFLEGVRARLEDKDDRPVWKPARLEDVDLSDFPES